MSERLCPHCNKPLNLPPRATYNASAYHKPVISITLCCGHAVRVSMRCSYVIHKVTHLKEDDWGYKIKDTPTDD